MNGKTWPYLSVAPRKYRFHFLDGSNARFYRMWLMNLANNTVGPAFIQVGTDGGLLDNPVTIDPKAGQKLFLGCGERADVVIDFSKCAPGTVLTLMNDANGPYPTGDPVIAGLSDRIMQFVVNGKMISRINAKFPGQDQSNIPHYLRLSPIVKFSDFAGHLKVKPDVVRQLTLNEVESPNGPVMVLVNNSRYMPMPGMFGAPTENTTEGKTELWQIINLTMDAHPMHMHLVEFQPVSRQSFDAMAYMTDYMNSFTGVNGGMAGMYMGAEGPPFLYDNPNAEGALGGNLPISKYLTGPVRAVDPNEKGWKDVLKAYPNEITTYIVRFAPVDLPLWTPKNRLKYSFDPAKGPGYVWHCHIVEHEDNDMMRPLFVQANPLRYQKLDDFNNTNYSDNLSGGFTLNQNYPNPVTYETEFSFSVPYDCHMKLILMNYMGETIRTIIDADVPSGNQTVRLSSDDLRPGVYFYQMSAGTFKATRTFVVK